MSDSPQEPPDQITPGRGGSSEAPHEVPATDEVPVTGAATDAGGAVAARPGRRARRKAARRNRLASRSKLRRRLTRSGITVVTVVIVLIAATAGYLIYRVNQIGRVAVHGLTPAETTGKAAGAQNFLLVGSTSRCAVTPAKNFQNFVNQCINGVNGVNSDVVMVLRVRPGHPASVLSIPRDTFVPNARVGNNANKIDAALYNGPSQLVAAIQEDLGIPINHYVVLNFQSFANIVTALGGITMYFPTSLYDSYSGLDISHSGCLHISGLEALALVRARHMQYDYNKATGQWQGYDPTGDIGRIERVHTFLKVLASEVAKRGLTNPVTDNSLLSAIAPDLTVDTTLGTSQMVSLLLRYHASFAGAQELTLPVVQDSQNTYSYKGYDYGAVVFPDQPLDNSTIARFMGAPLKMAPASSVSVAVVDGAGSPTGAAAVAAGLKADGLHVTGPSESTPVGPIVETTVVYPTKALEPAAERVLSSLQGTAVMEQGPVPAGSQVELITGTNATLTPASPAAGTGTTATTGSTATSTTASTTGTRSVEATLLSVLLQAAGIEAAPTVPNANGVLAPPTPANAALPSYDPRACPIH
ncbi:MAG: cell envelope-related transcriptional attenuator [Acidimicrobiaceae bacterium]|nr:cell envelope-related transcriptional attenuator [Acidimicrobiaceae bacterium]